MAKKTNGESTGVLDKQHPLEAWLSKTYGTFGKKLAKNIKSLSPEQQAFCESYLTCGNPAQAAREAGLYAPTPQLLLHLPQFAAYLNIAAAKMEIDLGRASAAEMLDRLRSTPMITESNTFVNPEITKEIEGLLSDDAAALSEVGDDELAGNIEQGANADFGIQQVPPVKVILQNQIFGPGWIMEQLIRVAERCLQIEPVYDKRGRPIGQFQFQSQAALKSLELLGKTFAMFNPTNPDPPPLGADETDQRIALLLAAHPELAEVMGKLLGAAKLKAITSDAHLHD